MKHRVPGLGRDDSVDGTDVLMKTPVHPTDVLRRHRCPAGWRVVASSKTRILVAPGNTRALEH